ncbi:MAG: DUF6576 domain-containing protein, partial [Gemmatimonadales bacterium]
LSGALYFVLRGIARPADPMPLSAPRPRVPVAARGGGGVSQQPDTTAHPDDAAQVQSPREPQAHRGAEAVEIDRVLDKISATGIDSLTADERRFLDTVAQRRRNVN